MNAAFKYFSVKWTLIAFIPDSNKEQRKKLQTLFGWAASCMCLKSLSEVIWVFILLSVSNASWRTTVDSYTFRTESLLLLVFHLSTDLAPQNQCCWHLENRNKKILPHPKEDFSGFPTDLSCSAKLSTSRSNPDYSLRHLILVIN